MNAFTSNEGANMSMRARTIEILINELEIEQNQLLNELAAVESKIDDFNTELARLEFDRLTHMADLEKLVTS